MTRTFLRYHDERGTLIVGELLERPKIEVGEDIGGWWRWSAQVRADVAGNEHVVALKGDAPTRNRAIAVARAQVRELVEAAGRAVELEWETPKGRLEFMLLAKRGSIGYPTPGGWILPSKADRIVRFHHALEATGGRIVGDLETGGVG